MFYVQLKWYLYTPSRPSTLRQPQIRGWIPGFVALQLDMRLSCKIPGTVGDDLRADWQIFSWKIRWKPWNGLEKFGKNRKTATGDAGDHGFYYPQVPSAMVSCKPLDRFWMGRLSIGWIFWFWRIGPESGLPTWVRHASLHVYAS